MKFPLMLTLVALQLFVFTSCEKEDPRTSTVIILPPPPPPKQPLPPPPAFE